MSSAATATVAVFRDYAVKVLKARSGLFSSTGILVIILYREYKKTLNKSSSSSSSITTTTTKSDKSTSNKPKNARIGVDARFWEQIKKLLPICFGSQELGLLGSLAVLLFARSALDIWFSSFNGRVVKAIVSRDSTSFIKRVVVEFGLMMWPLSIVNNALKLNISALSLAVRNKLTKRLHELYFRDLTYYKVTNLDNRVSNPDQLFTQDIEKFSETLSHLYSDTAKPLVDICLFASKLSEALGSGAPTIMVSYFLASAMALRTFSPAFGKYTAQEQKLSGDFRFAHSRVITHAEEIAFYGGNEKEKLLANESFDKIVTQVRRVFFLKFFNGIFDSIFVKYLATILAYYLLARPVFNAKYATSLMGGAAKDPTQLMEEYSRNSSYLVNLSQAVGRVILAGRDLTRFAGYTHRVAELFGVLEEVNQGIYRRTMVTTEEKGQPTKAQTIGPGDLKGKVEIRDGIIQFIKTPIVTPNGDVLINELNLTVNPGMNVMITGPNGSGKSSLFRLLGGLWPLFGGTLVKPSAGNLFYVPQKPYLCVGTLRDQIIYPDTKEQAYAKGYTDERLKELLRIVILEYLVSREGFDSIQDWGDVLSGGEKQRISFARLFYHHPAYAILDECTSAVSIDVEGDLYTHAKKEGITLFTVSHRPSLFKYHDYVLKFDGEGSYSFEKMEHGTTNPFDFGHGKTTQVDRM